MIESANRNPAVVAVMTSYGYLHAVRRDRQLALHPERAADTFLDGYWLHPDRIDSYRRLGIMADASVLADGLIEYRQDGRTKQTTATFFRGSHANFHPTDESLRRDGIGDCVMKGHTPSERFITRDMSIVAFGSCFAANISNHLHSRGYRVLTRIHSDPYVSSMGDGIVNTYAIRQQFEWAWENRQPTTALWHGYDATAFGYDEQVRRATRAMFDQADVFILTLGLSEVWYDEPTGEVFWRAVPKAAYDDSRHKFRLTTVDENTNNLLAIRRLIRRHRPHAHIVVTLSPIPLTATFRGMSCITANAVSKATLRVAVDQFISAAVDPHVYYFPSYEIVTALFQNAFMEDRKHPHHHVLEFNMNAFEHYFCEGSLKRAELDNAFTRARQLDQLVGTEGHFSVHRTMNPKAGGATREVSR